MGHVRMNIHDNTPAKDSKADGNHSKITMPQKELSVLIAGAGIAGPSLALLLARLGHKCTIVERAPDFRATGQQVDVAGEALKIIKYMGIHDACWDRRVADDGIKFVNANDEVQAAFPPSNESGSWVKELEILRPDLAEVFFEATKGDVDYIFNETIKSVKQNEEGVTTTFANAPGERTFDLLVAADGLRSGTRTLAFGEDNTELVTFNQYAGYFSIPWTEQDGSWTKWYNVPGGRTVSTRPNIHKKTTGAYLCQITPDASKVATMTVGDQKRELTKRFEGAGWQTDRILKCLNGPEGETFYCQEVAQTKSQHIVQGRVALLGDAGYCPAPISGQGSSVALVGAYILAGCIDTHSSVEEALRQYAKQVKPFVDAAQNLPPGVPWIVNPQSGWAITVLNRVLGAADAVVNSGFGEKLSQLVSPVTSLLGGRAPVLPEYPSIHVQPK